MMQNSKSVCTARQKGPVEVNKHDEQGPWNDDKLYRNIRVGVMPKVNQFEAGS